MAPAWWLVWSLTWLLTQQPLAAFAVVWWLENWEGGATAGAANSAPGPQRREGAASAHRM